MEPEEDYFNFMYCLKDAAKNDDYVALLPGFLRLVSILAKKEDFPEKIEVDKECFATKDMPAVISVLCDKDYLSEEEKTQILNFLQELALLLITGLKNGVVEFIDPIKTVFNSYKEIYFEVEFSKILEFCKENGILQLIEDIIDTVQDVNTSEIFQATHFVIKSLQDSDVFKESELETIVKKYDNIYINNYIDRLMADKTALRDSKNDDVLSLIKKLIEETSEKATLEKVFDFAKFCLKSDLMEKNLLGIDILFIGRMHIKDKLLLHEWVEKNNMIEFFLTTNFHDECLKAIGNKSLFLFAGVKPTIEQLQNLLKRIISNSFQRDGLIVLFVRSLFLAQATSETISQFLDGDFDPKIKSEISFCGLRYNRQKDQCIALTYADLYIKYTDDITKELIYQLMNPLGIENINKLIDIYQERIIKGDINKNIISAFPFLLNMSDKTISSEVVHHIIGFLKTNPELSNGLFALINNIVRGTEYVFTPEDIQIMFEQESMTECYCMSIILLDRFCSCLTEESKALLIDILKNLSPDKYTEMHAYLVFVFILANAYENNLISEFTGCLTTFQHLSTLDLPYIDLLIHLFMNAKNSSAQEYASQYLCSIFGTEGPKLPDVVDHILKLFNPYILGDDSEKQTRALNLIKLFIINNESNKVVSDYGVIRHHEKRDDNQWNIYVMFLSDNSFKQIKVNPEKRIEKLITRIAIMSNVDPCAVSLKNGNITLNPNFTLYESGVINGGFVTCSILPDRIYKTRYGKEMIPSYLFGKKEFTSKLISFLNNDVPEELQKAASSLLNMLPTDEGVLEKIRENMKETLEESSKNRRMQKYVFRAILQAVDQNIISYEFTSCPEFAQIWNNLKNGEIDPKNECSALEIFSHVVPIDENGKSDVLFMLKGLTKEKDYRRIMMEIFHHVFQLDNVYVSKSLADNSEFFAECCINFDSEVNMFFISYIGFFADEYKGTIFNGMIKKLDEISKAKDPTNVLIFISLMFDRNCPTKDALEFCKKFINCAEYSRGISCIITKIFRECPGVIADNRDIITEIMREFIKKCPTEAGNDLFNIISSAAVNDDGSLFAISKPLEGFFNFKFDNWGYDTKREMKTLPNHTGLSNLGCTCYMNAVLQQLFACKDYREQIISAAKSEKAWVNSIREIFTKMKYTLRRSVTTRSFCSTFLFNEVDPINTRQQQDASEFYMTLVDQLNSASISSNDFKIPMRLHFSGVDEEFDKEIVEDQFVISVPIKKISNLDEFLNSFTESEINEDYYADTLKKKIKIKTTTRIKEAPKILVFQLVRFEYNVKKGRRTKLNKKFKFPNEIDIKQLMIDNSSHQYKLKGTIIHYGVADMGHYFSLIKEGDQWVEYNDDNVTPITKSEFKNFSYGTDDSVDEFGSQSAYLLFYEKIEENEHKEEPKETVDAELMKEIQDDNQLFNKIQAAFSPTMYKLVSKLSDVKILLEYFLNVFIHSSEAENNLGFFAKLNKLIKDFDCQKLAMSFFVENKESVGKALISSMSEYIMPRFVSFIRKLVDNTDPCDSLELINYLIDIIPTCISCWRQTTNITLIIAEFFNQKAYDTIKKENLFTKLLQNIYDFVAALPNDNAKCSVDLSEIIDKAECFVSSEDSVIEQNFMGLFTILFNNPSSAVAFSRFIMSCVSASVVKFEITYNIIKKTFDDYGTQTKAIIYLLRGCHNSEEVASVINEITKIEVKNPTFLLDRFRDSVRDAEFNCLMNEYQGIIFTFVRQRNKDVRLAAESLFYQLFPLLEPPGPETGFEDFYDYSEEEEDVKIGELKASSQEIVKIANFKPAIYETLDYMISLAKRIPKAVNKKSRCVSIIRISSWVMNRTAPDDEILQKLLALLDLLIKVKNGNVNLLHILIALSLLPGEKKMSYGQMYEKMFKDLFPLDGEEGGAVNASIFFRFFKLSEEFYKKNVDEFAKIVSDDVFLPTFMYSITYSKKIDIVAFLSFLKFFMKNEEIKQKLFDIFESCSDLIEEFYPPDKSATISSLLLEFQRVDLSPGIEASLHAFCDAYLSKESCEEAVKNLEQLEITGVPIWLRDSLIPNIHTVTLENVKVGFPIISKLCSIAQWFRESYFHELYSDDLKIGSSALYQLVLILQIFPLQKYCEVVLSTLAFDLNDNKNIEKLGGITEEMVVNILENACPTSALLGTLIGSLLSLDNKEFGKEILVASVNETLKIKNGKVNILYAKIKSAAKAAINTGTLSVIIPHISLIITEFRYLKNEILKLIKFDDNVFNEWPEDCFEYIEQFIKDDSEDEEGEEESSKENESELEDDN